MARIQTCVELAKYFHRIMTYCGLRWAVQNMIPMPPSPCPTPPYPDPGGVLHNRNRRLIQIECAFQTDVFQEMCCDFISFVIRTAHCVREEDASVHCSTRAITMATPRTHADTVEAKGIASEEKIRQGTPVFVQQYIFYRRRNPLPI